MSAASVGSSADGTPGPCAAMSVSLPRCSTGLGAANARTDETGDDDEESGLIGDRLLRAPEDPYFGERVAESLRGAARW
jgi:hypothetical protein